MSLTSRVLKSINRWFNKLLVLKKSQLAQGNHSSVAILALLRERDNKIKAYIEKIACILLDYCQRYGIDKVIVGYIEWKQRCNLGAKTNQNFIQIPHRQLLDRIRFVLEAAGISYQETEEAHASKVNHYGLEPMCHHEQYRKRRIHRGLILTDTGQVSNADTHGSIGSARKVMGDRWMRAFTVANSGKAPVPVRYAIRMDKVHVVDRMFRGAAGETSGAWSIEGVMAMGPVWNTHPKSISKPYPSSDTSSALCQSR